MKVHAQLSSIFCHYFHLANFDGIIARNTGINVMIEFFLCQIQTYRQQHPGDQSPAKEHEQTGTPLPGEVTSLNPIILNSEALPPIATAPESTQDEAPHVELTQTQPTVTPGGNTRQTRDGAGFAASTGNVSRDARQTATYTHQNAPAAKALPSPVPFFKLTAAPHFQQRALPVFPENMNRLGRTGIVKVEVLIDGQGVVRKVTILSSAGEDFDQAAITALLASRFSPGRLNEKPVAVLYRTQVEFKLQ